MTSSPDYDEGYRAAIEDGVKAIYDMRKERTRAEIAKVLRALKQKETKP